MEPILEPVFAETELDDLPALEEMLVSGRAELKLVKALFEGTDVSVYGKQLPVRKEMKAWLEKTGG